MPRWRLLSLTLILLGFIAFGADFGKLSVACAEDLQVPFQVPWSQDVTTSPQGGSIGVDGYALWTIRYALGDPAGLPPGGDYAIGTPLFSQSLSLDLHGSVSKDLSLKAHLDNLNSSNLQLLDLNLNAGPVTARVGRLRAATQNDLVLRESGLSGVQARTESVLPGIGAITAVGIAGRAEGIPASKTFRGHSGTDTIEFQPGGPYSPSREDGNLLATLDGAEFFASTGQQVLDADLVTASYAYLDDATGPGASARRSLRDLLSNYDLDYLYRTLPSDGGVIAPGDEEPVDRSAFTSADSGSETYLILKVEALDLLREQVRNLIAQYNQQNGLIGKDRKSYPFVVGSETERSFLEELASDHVRIIARPLNATQGSPPLLNAPLTAYERRRFFWLGATDVLEPSLKVEVKKAGLYVPAADVADLRVMTYLDRGLLELDAPPGFFDDIEAIRVSYSYAIPGNAFALGISVAYGSEKVYLNGKPLKKDEDYTIDYESGILVLLRPVTAEDELRIDFEYFRAGLGGGAEYNRNLYGVTLNFRSDVLKGLVLNAEAYRSADSRQPLVEPDKAKTMPNSHTVVGLSGELSSGVGALAKLDASWKTAYSHDLFPFDNNGRRHPANAVNAILIDNDSASRSYVFVAHQNGLGVFFAGTWHQLDTTHGLSNDTVLSIAHSDTHWFFGTESGLTLAKKPSSEKAGSDSSFPLDLAEAWTRIYKNDGLPGNRIFGLYFDGSSLWVATDEGLGRARMALGSDLALTGWEVWRPSSFGLKSDTVTGIWGGPLPGTVFVATTSGLMLFDAVSASFTQELPGRRVTSLVAEDGYFAAGTDDDGLWMRPTLGSSWTQAAGTDGLGIQALLFQPGSDRIWLGTNDGLLEYIPSRNLPGAADGLIGARLLDNFAITALGDGPFGFWAGSDGSQEPGVVVWELASGAEQTPSPHFPTETNIAADDVNHYVDASPEGHIAAGLAAEGEIVADFGSAQVSGRFRKVDPGFSTIGRDERRDIQEWALAASVAPVPGLTLKAEHASNETGQDVKTPISSNSTAEETSTAIRRYLVTDGVQLSWATGPKVDVSYVLSKAGDIGKSFDTIRRVYSVSATEKWWNDRLAATGSIEHSDLVSTADSSQNYSGFDVKGKISATPLPGLNVAIDFYRPLTDTTRTDAPRLDSSRQYQDLNLQGRWQGRIKGSTIAIAFLQDIKAPVTPRDTSVIALKKYTNATAGLYGNTSTWVVFGHPLELSPTAQLTYDGIRTGNADDGDRLRAQGSSRFRWGKLTSDWSYRGQLSLTNRDGKTRADNSLHTNWTYEIRPRLNVSLDVGYDASTVAYPSLGSSASRTTGVAIALDYEGISAPATQPSPQAEGSLFDSHTLLAFKRELNLERTKTQIRLGESLTYIPKSRSLQNLTFGLALDGTLNITSLPVSQSQPTAPSMDSRLEMTAKTGYRLSSTWSLNASASYVLTQRSYSVPTLTHTVLTSLSVSASF